MDEKLKRIEAELKKLGINTVDDLNRAIKNQEKLELISYGFTASGEREDCRMIEAEDKL